jgi:hypothetical protein
VPESELHVLPEDLAGKDAIELGCARRTSQQGESMKATALLPALVLGILMAPFVAEVPQWRLKPLIGVLTPYSTPTDGPLSALSKPLSRASTHLAKYLCICFFIVPSWQFAEARLRKVKLLLFRYLARIIHQPEKSTKASTCDVRMAPSPAASQAHHEPKSSP